MKFWNLSEVVDTSKTIEEVTSRNSIKLELDPFYFAIIGSRLYNFHRLEDDRYKLVRWSFWP